MSDANRVAIGYIKETVFGVMPSGPPTLQLLRYTRESLGMDTDTVISEEIRADRQDADISRVGISAAGDVGFELSQDTYDDWFESVLLSAGWSAAVVVDAADAAISATAVDDSFNHTTAWAINPDVGQWIEVRGFLAEETNNGFFKVLSVTGTKIVVEQTGVLVDEAAGDPIDIDQGGQILNGTTFASYAIEKEYGDLSNEFAALNGMVLDGFSMAVPVDGLITGAFTFMGKIEASGTATIGDGSPTAVSATDVMNSIDNVVKIEEAYAAFAATAFSFAVVNNHRNQNEIANLGAVGMGTGSVGVTGSLTAYFKTKAAFDKYLNFTETNLTLVTRIGAETYIIEFPKVKFTGGRRVSGGKNTDVMAELEWAATRQTTESVTIRMVRFT